jgi:uncharacterized protein
MSNLQEPLSNDELDRLESFLDKGGARGGMNLEETDGFLTALMCCPDLVPPSKFIPKVWGADDQEPEFESSEQGNDIVTLLLRHWNAIGSVLSAGDVYLPVVGEIADGVPNGSDWGKGFLRGMQLSHESWDELIQSDENSACLIPILALVHEHDPDPEMRPTPIAPEKRVQLLAFAAAGVMKAYEYFAPHRRALGRAVREQRIRRRETPKIGRNAPCPCGSGKKFKVCCGRQNALRLV